MTCFQLRHPILEEDCGTDFVRVLYHEHEIAISARDVSESELRGSEPLEGGAQVTCPTCNAHFSVLFKQQSIIKVDTSDRSNPEAQAAIEEQSRIYAANTRIAQWVSAGTLSCVGVFVSGLLLATRGVRLGNLLPVVVALAGSAIVWLMIASLRAKRRRGWEPSEAVILPAGRRGGFGYRHPAAKSMVVEICHVINHGTGTLHPFVPVSKEALKLGSKAVKKGWDDPKGILDPVVRVLNDEEWRGMKLGGFAIYTSGQ